MSKYMLYFNSSSSGIAEDDYHTADSMDDAEIVAKEWLTEDPSGIVEIYEYKGKICSEITIHVTLEDGDQEVDHVIS